MSIIGSNLLAGASGQGGAYEIERSLRFNDGDTAYLNRTPSSAGNQTTWTYSVWFKRSNLGAGTTLFSAGSSAYVQIYFTSDDKLRLLDYNGGTQGFLETSQVFRDVSAWYHVVVVVDTTDGTAADRQKIYVNGERITDFGSQTNYGSSDTTAINGTVAHTIGKHAPGTEYWDGYMAEINLIDGTAEDASAFGETDEDTGAWIPKQYSGSYGTNGFYLNFSDNSSVSALGTDGSGNGNNWTPNNFSVPVNPSYPYALSATGGVYDRDKAFDGSTSTFAGTNTSDTITFAPSGGIAYSTSVEFYTSSGGGSGSNDQRYSFNGGAEVNCSGGEYTTVASGSGTLTSLAVRNTFGAPSRLNAIRIDGSIVLAEFGTGIDSLEDTPTNNWCTFNPLKKGTITVSEGSLKAVGGADYQGIHGTIGLPSTGKFYWEATVNSTSGAVTDQFIGVAGNDTAVSGTSPYPQGDTPALYYVGTGTLTKNGTTSVQTGLGAFAADDVIGVAYDADASTVQFYKNGSAVGTAESLPSTTETLFPAYIATTNRFANFNWGQRSFDQTPPTGYEALNTANLPVPTIENGADHFDTLIYTGNATARSITGLNFAPDFVWHKARSAADDHRLMDSVRAGGTDLSSSILFSNLADAEASLTGQLTQTSNGFDLVATTNFNNSGRTFVAWNWKANGGTTESLDAGTITSTVCRNATAGFSIVEYTGNSTLGATVAHGLGVAPKMIITKSSSTSLGNWAMYHYGMDATNPADYAININGTASRFDSNLWWNDTEPTDTVFSIGTTNDVNGASDYIAYCFAEVEGYSKFGSYESNNSTNGPFVYTGFRPAFVICKDVDRSGMTWIQHDTARSPYNAATNSLAPNNASTEPYDTASPIDILSNGFKLRGGSSSYNNYLTETYIYIAFAETPFKYANAR